MLDFSILPKIYRVEIFRDGRVNPCPICGGKSKSCVIKVDEDGNERIGCFRPGCGLKRPKTIRQFLDEFELWTYAFRAKKNGWIPLSYGSGISFSRSSQSPTSPSKPINPTIYTMASELFEQDLQMKLGYQVRERGHKLGTLRHFHVGFVSPYRNYAEELRRLGEETGLWSYDELTESGLFYFSKASKFGACAVGRGLYSYPIYDGDYVRSIKYKGVDEDGEKCQYSLAVEDTGNDFPYFLNHEGLSAEKPILVEGENDMLSMWEEGYKQTVCLFGGLKQRQVEYMDLSKTFVLGFDHDEQDEHGKRAGEEHTKKAQKSLPHTEVLDYPFEFHDPDDWCKGRI